jgi:hypothetical protein
MWNLQSTVRRAVTGGGVPGGSREVEGQRDRHMLMLPKALKVSENQFEVMVKDADGKPLSGADVSVPVVMPAMPAMPAMKMAEMRTEVKLNGSGANTSTCLGIPSHTSFEGWMS